MFFVVREREKKAIEMEMDCRGRKREISGNTETGKETAKYGKRGIVTFKI